MNKKENWERLTPDYRQEITRSYLVLTDKLFAEYSEGIEMAIFVFDELFGKENILGGDLIEPSDDINLLKFLSEKNLGEMFYSPFCGKCVLDSLEGGKIKVRSIITGGLIELGSNGKFTEDGEIMLFPILEGVSSQVSPQGLWEIWKRTKYIVTVSVGKGKDDPNPGEYSVSFDTLDEAINSAKSAREALDKC